MGVVWRSRDSGRTGTWGTADSAAQAPARPSRRWKRRTHPGDTQRPPGWPVACPACPRCDSPMVWRGTWRCDACVATIPWAEYSGDGPLVATPRELPIEALAGVPVFSPSEGNNSAKSRRDRQTLEWLDRVEMYTSWFRCSRAARHRWKYGNGDSSYHWHRSREVGQGERFNRVRRCGEPMAEMVSDSGRSFVLTRRCDCWRVCASCLRRRRMALIEGLRDAEKRVRVERKRQLSRAYAGPEGRWSAKLVTLTVPHSGSARTDAKALATAWAELSRRWTTHLKKDRGAEKSPVWVRALEVAPNENGGHAHLHVWYVGPFIEHAWLRTTWGDILESKGVRCPREPWESAMGKAVDQRARVWCRTMRGRNGRERESLPWPVVDVRSAYDSGAGSYAAKVGVQLYVAKGAKGEPQRMEAVHAAVIYEAFEGRRAFQWARGWAPRKQPTGESWRMQRLSDESLWQLREAETDAVQVRQGTHVGAGRVSAADVGRQLAGGALVRRVRANGGDDLPGDMGSRGGIVPPEMDSRGTVVVDAGVAGKSRCPHWKGVTSRDAELRRAAFVCGECGQLELTWRDGTKRVFRLDGTQVR